MTQQRQTQIFVAPDGDVKFEMNPDAMDVINAQNLVGIQQAGTSQHQHGLKQPKIEQNAGTSNQAGYYPVKKRNMAAVTKCHKCNGSGVIFIGGHKNSKVPPQEKPFHCNICGGSFSRYSSLWSHKKLHSGGKHVVAIVLFYNPKFLPVELLNNKQELLGVLKYRKEL